MYSRWTKKLTDEQEKDFRSSISSSVPVLKQLRMIVKEDKKASETSQSSREYTDASWAYSQADSIGEKRAYDKVLKMINNLIGEE